MGMSRWCVSVWFANAVLCHTASSDSEIGECLCRGGVCVRSSSPLRCWPFPPGPTSSRPLPYDLVYVRAPYFGRPANSVWPDTVRPLVPARGAARRCSRRRQPRGALPPRALPRPDRHPRRQPLSVGSVSDLNVSFDGRLGAVHLVPRPDRRQLAARCGLVCAPAPTSTSSTCRPAGWSVSPRRSCTPNTGNGAQVRPRRPERATPAIGVFNTGGTWAPGGRIVFTSNRNNFLPPKAMNSGQRVLQLFVMRRRRRQRRADRPPQPRHGAPSPGAARRPHRLLELGGARRPRHAPVPALGHRPGRPRLDGPLGILRARLVHHFMTQMPGGDLVVTRYYNLNNNGFGDLVRYPLDPPGPDFGTADPDRAERHDPLPARRPGPADPVHHPRRLPAPCPGWEDNPYGSAVRRPAACAARQRRGKLTHPAATPSAAGDPGGADLLAVYSPGPANHNGIYVGAGTALPWYHGEIVLLPDGAPVPVPPAGQPGRPPHWSPCSPRTATTCSGRGRWSPGSSSTASTAPARLAGARRRRHPRRAAGPGRAVRPDRQLLVALARHGRRLGPGRRRSRPLQRTGDESSYRWVRQGGRRRGLRRRRHLGGAHPHAAGGRPTAPIRTTAALRRRRRRAHAHPRRDPGAQGRAARAAAARRPEGNRHQLPGPHAGRHVVHLPDARPPRHGAQHGADLAPGAAGRGALRLRRLPRPQQGAARLRGAPPRRGPATRFRDLARSTPLLALDARASPAWRRSPRIR